MSDAPDVDMKVTTNKDDKNKEQEKTNIIYSEYKKLLITMEKAATIKDSKTLVQCYNQINKYRLNFSANEFSFISELVLNNTFKTSIIKPLDSANKESLSILFNFNSKTLIKFHDVSEISYFNRLLLILHLIDYGNASEAFSHLQKLISDITSFDSQTVWHLKAKSYFYLFLEAEKLGQLNSIFV